MSYENFLTRGGDKSAVIRYRQIGIGIFSDTARVFVRCGALLGHRPYMMSYAMRRLSYRADDTYRRTTDGISSKVSVLDRIIPIPYFYL